MEHSFSDGLIVYTSIVSRNQREWQTWRWAENSCFQCHVVVVSWWRRRLIRLKWRYQQNLLQSIIINCHRSHDTLFLFFDTFNSFIMWFPFLSIACGHIKKLWKWSGKNHFESVYTFRTTGDKFLSWIIAKIVFALLGMRFGKKKVLLLTL